MPQDGIPASELLCQCPPGSESPGEPGVRSFTSEARSHVHMGCRHHRWRLSVLHHVPTPLPDFVAVATAAQESTGATLSALFVYSASSGSSLGHFLPEELNKHWLPDPGTRAVQEVLGRERGGDAGGLPESEVPAFSFTASPWWGRGRVAPEVAQQREAANVCQATNKPGTPLWG